MNAYPTASPTDASLAAPRAPVTAATPAVHHGSFLHDLPPGSVHVAPPPREAHRILPIPRFASAHDIRVTLRWLEDALAAYVDRSDVGDAAIGKALRSAFRTGTTMPAPWGRLDGLIEDLIEALDPLNLGELEAKLALEALQHEADRSRAYARAAE